VGLSGGLDGQQLADAALLLRPYLRILFITGYAQSAITRHNTLQSEMPILIKPFSMRELANRIKEILT
jgi:DNA-binding response OmpR family regulator